jgi:CO dehydrogenase nickel-insertion accessory protein CooC1
MRLSPEFEVEIRKRIEKVMKTIDIEKAVEVLNEVTAGRMEVSKERMKAIELTLKHGLPTHRAVEVTGANGGPVQIEGIVIRSVDATPDRPA